MKSELVLLALSSALALGQFVCGGTELQCRKAQSERCAKAELPNLIAGSAKSIKGTMTDITGAPFPMGYVVQLRNAARSVVLSSATLRAGGYFEFAEIPLKSTRLILVKMVGDVPKRFGFLQPSNLSAVL